MEKTAKVLAIGGAISIACAIGLSLFATNKNKKQIKDIYANN